MKISDIKVTIISDSRGEDTLEVEMESNRVKVSASVPSGKSTGKNEAFVLPPKKAVEKIPWIFSQIKDHEFATLDQFDQLLMTLDGTGSKSRLGGNLILVLSIAFTKLLAKLGNLEIYELISKISGSPVGGLQKLPLCFFNLVGGGVHAQDSLPFQEYWFIPQTTSPKESLNQTLIFLKSLGEKIHQRFGDLKQGDEGSYSVPSADPLEGLKILEETRREGKWEETRLGIDVAASTFFKDGSYDIGGKSYEKDELLAFYKKIAEEFNLLAMEDPFDQDDFDAFKNVIQILGEKVWIIGDDLLTTNITRMKMAHEKNAVNAMIIKPNQIGSVSETIQAANLAKSYGWKIIVSHRSGETMDSFIADLAIGLGADGLKAGCPLQKERLVKYQRLIEIEERM